MAYIGSKRSWKSVGGNSDEPSNSHQEKRGKLSDLFQSNIKSTLTSGSSSKEHINDPLFWGPYLAERQWGTVREDYSLDGSWYV